MRTASFLPVLLLASTCLLAPPFRARSATLESATGPLKLTLDDQAALTTISFNGQPVIEYAFGTNRFKPCVHALHSLKGDNVLIDWPPDHVHHHGLMYAITVNGINFWEEQTDPGVQRAIGLPGRDLGTNVDGLPKAVLTQTIHWVAQSNRFLADTQPVALLIEQRRLTLTVNEKAGEVAVEWQGDFEVGPGADQVTLTGKPYHGLGLRFIHEFDHVAKRLNSGGLGYLPAGGDEVTPSVWSAMIQNVNGRDLTVSMHKDPLNAGASTFFSMLNGFAYLSATQALDKQPLAYRRGAKFRLRYLVTVTTSALTADQLEARHRAWRMALRRPSS
ncbi:MAG: DUF6807 family protein [Verrucomicrobiota bacterium]|jgi:hypothetical protein